MPVARPPHRVTLVRLQREIRTRSAGAEQDKARLSVLRKVASRVVLIDLAVQEARGTREAPSLKAAVRQFDARVERGVQDVLVRAYREGHHAAVRLLQPRAIDPFSGRGGVGRGAHATEANTSSHYKAQRLHPFQLRTALT
jgi:hypothetical protein